MKIKEKILFAARLCVLIVFFSYILSINTSNKKESTFIVTPIRVDKNGAPVDEHQSFNQVHYKISFQGRDYQLDLHTNQMSNSRNIVVERTLPKINNTRSVFEKKHTKHKCNFIGSIKGYPDSEVSLSNCDGLQDQIRSRSKRSSAVHPIPPDHDPGHVKRLYIEITLVLDKTLIDYHSTIDLENYMITIMNIANAGMSESSFGAPCELSLVRMIRLEQEDDELNLIMTEKSEKVLDIFEAWQQRLNPTYDTHPDHHDMAILVTRVDICAEEEPFNCGLLGIARLGALCNPVETAMVAEDNGLGLGYTIAHEMGHAMGMIHDELIESGCEPRPYEDNYTVMMADSVDLHNWGWTNCSREALWAWLDTGRGSCLYDVPQSDRYPLGKILPGAAYGVGFQCTFLYGKEATVCADIGSECHNLKCHIPNDGCVQSYQPLADGTECGEHRWCYHGKCVNQGSRPDAIDGGWSDWGSWSACSRTCGGGVSRSIRQCDSPQPAHTGLYCTGQRTKFQICNSAQCPPGQPTFRQVQCTEFDSMVYPMTNRTHTWKGIPTTTQNPCELVCENEEGEMTILKSEVVDGTPCYQGEHHLCVAGYCKRVPCNYVLDSPAVEDACGVCHGDGSSCVIQSVEESFLATNKYQTMMTLNKTVKFALFEELNPSKSYFMVFSGSEKVIVAQKWGVTMVDNMRFWMGQEKHQQDILKIRGPITKDLTVTVGAKDEVTIRATIGFYGIESRDKVTFKWEYVDWSECSEPCGPGTEIAEAKCIENTNGVVEDKYCFGKEKPPPETRVCELKECEPRWQVGEWSGCDCTCEMPEGSRLVEERAVDCVRRAGNHEEVFVADLLCESPKPESVRDCTCPNHPQRKRRKDSKHRKHHKPTKAKNHGKHHHRTTTHIGVMERSHIQNIHALEEMIGSVYIDRQNVDNLHFALEIDEFNKNTRSKDFPQPRPNENLVHLKGRPAVEFLWKIQKEGHRKNKHQF